MNQYKIQIKDLKQPLLVSRKEVRVSGEPEKREYMFCMVPELCYLTGLQDKEKKNFTVMKDLATYTKLTPHQRVHSYKKYLDNVNNTPEAKEILDQWGLSLEKDPKKVEARLIGDQQIYFGGGKEVSAGPRAEFSRDGKCCYLLCLSTQF